MAENTEWSSDDLEKVIRSSKSRKEQRQQAELWRHRNQGTHRKTGKQVEQKDRDSKECTENRESE